MNFIERIKLFDSVYTYSVFIIIISYSLYLMSKGNYFARKQGKIGSILFLFVLTIYFGIYPYGGGGDRTLYVNAFNYGEYVSSDILWETYVKVCSIFLPDSIWLLLTAFLYLIGFYLYAKKTHPHFAIIMLLGFLGFMFFKSYAINTMRSGVATSLFYYSLISFYNDKKKIFLLLTFLVINTHLTLALPALSLIISMKYPRTRTFFYFWILSIPLSAVAGNYFQALFEPILSDYSNGKAHGYLMEEDNTEYKSGFRIDFILYSLLPVLLSYYYIFIRKLKDTFYIHIFNAYLVANSFWILVIRADFSDRMAYLSWLLIPILILYPALKYKIWSNQNVNIAFILIFQELFTFILAIR